MAPLMTACGGFLLAVLWMDLLFDSQVRAHPRASELPEPVLAAIAAYYHRATTTSRPMSRLIAAVMLILLGGLAFAAFRGCEPRWVVGTAALFSGGPILLAALRTVPNAVRLGLRSGSTAEQSRRARSIYRDHVVCFVSMLAFLALWLGIAA